MYFVVFINQIKQNRVVPHTWIRGVSSQLENFINFGINKRITHHVFWTDKPEAFDENWTPRTGYRPNMCAGLSNVFPGEGWYGCKIIRFQCKFVFKYKVLVVLKKTHFYALFVLVFQ